MQRTIPINYPESLALSLKMEAREFEHEMKTISLVKLYELGKVSSGFAAKILNISRVEFLELLVKYNVSYFSKDIDDEIEIDFRNA